VEPAGENMPPYHPGNFKHAHSNNMGVKTGVWMEGGTGDFIREQ
jgi:hypothetical protein